MLQIFSKLFSLDSINSPLQHAVKLLRQFILTLYSSKILNTIEKIRKSKLSRKLNSMIKKQN